MAQVAGLQDFRGEAPPADIGIFQFPCDVLVFKHTFAGTDYVCAVRAGARGWVLVSHLPVTAANVETVIEAAMGALTVGRTWKEHVVVKGDYTVCSAGTSIDVPIYIILEVIGKWTLANGVNAYMISLAVGNTQIEILGGFYDGNRANQTAGGIIVCNSTNVTIKGGYFEGAYECGLSITSTATDVLGDHLFFTDGRDDDVSIAGCRRVTLRDCTSYESRTATGASGFEIEDGATEITLQRCIAWNNNADIPSHQGFEVHAHAGSTTPTKIRLVDCIAYGQGRYGYYYGGVSTVHLNGDIEQIDCISDSHQYCGVMMMAYVDNVRIKGGSFTNGRAGDNRGINLEANCNNILIDFVHGSGNGRDIMIAAASVTNTRIGCNNLLESGTKLDDRGTGTKLPSLTFPFINGTLMLSADGAPWGWEIDADTEYAIALIDIPPFVQQVYKWRIKAVALVAEADRMRLEIVGRGGADNEAYTQESIDIANKASVSLNFAANDYIYWLLTATDDPDLDDLTGGDSLMVKVKHEAAGDGDCATDAAFLTVTIEYV